MIEVGTIAGRGAFDPVGVAVLRPKTSSDRSVEDI